MTRLIFDSLVVENKEGKYGQSEPIKTYNIEKKDSSNTGTERNIQDIIISDYNRRLINYMKKSIGKEVLGDFWIYDGYLHYPSGNRHETNRIITCKFLIESYDEEKNQVVGELAYKPTFNKYLPTLSTKIIFQLSQHESGFYPCFFNHRYICRLVTDYERVFSGSNLFPYGFRFDND